MRKLIIFIAVFGIIANSTAQQIPLKGVVSVQNSKTQTGKTQYVKNAEVTHPNAKNDVTDDDGKFTLNITGLKQNIQTQIAVALSGMYSDYVIVNEKELLDITLGRVTPVSVFICKKGDLEQRQAEMVGINMRKLEQRMEKDKNRLQKELEELKSKNDYLNVRYSQIKDSLDIISKNIDRALERIKEFAQTMVLENLDDKDDNYIKAYNCFAKGDLDSVKYYLRDDELNKKYQQLVQLQQDAKKKKELAAILTETAKAEEERYENGINELIKEWLLLAQTAAMQNKYEEAKTYYQKIISIDTTNADVIFEYARYLSSIREYAQAEKYYLQCLKRYRDLEKENPKFHLADIAKTLNNMANLHKDTKEYAKALEEAEEGLRIFRVLATENPKTYLVLLAQILHNSAIIYQSIKEYSKSLEKYEEALKIRKMLAAENPNAYLPDVARTLNNIANLYSDAKQYSKALEAYEEALKIRTALAADDPKAHLSSVAQTLNNLAILHSETDQYVKALEQFEKALEIYKKLAAENPKVYLYSMAATLNNVAVSYKDIGEYAKASEKYKDALPIFRELAAENPKTYLANVVDVLNNFSFCCICVKEYAQAEQYANEMLKLDSTALQGKIFIAHILLFQGHYAQAEKIYKELSQTVEHGNKTYKQTILGDFDELEKADAIPEEHKAEVEKIKRAIGE